MKLLSIPAERADNHERWLLTYADMITLLTAFFLMLYSMSVMSRGKFSMLATSVRSGFTRTQGRATTVPPGHGGNVHGDAQQVGAPNNYDSAVQNLSRFVEQHNLKGQVTTREDERGVVISMVADGLLFDRGKAQLKSESAHVLDIVADVVKQAPNHVQIEGHTCDLPIHTEQFPSNWELSASRAGAVLRYFTETAELTAVRFTVAGYADSRPLAPNDSENHRARNRRVEIVLLKTDAQRDVDLLRRAEIRRITKPQDH